MVVSGGPAWGGNRHRLFLYRYSGDIPEFRERSLEELRRNEPAVERLRKLASEHTVPLPFSARDGERNPAAVIRDSPIRDEKA